MKALVLNSGGIDSTTCVSMAIKKYGAENVVTLTIYYGQKLDKELLSAEKVAQHYKIPHYVLNLDSIFKNSKCSLIKGGNDVVHKTYEEQKDSIISSYVPFRNGLFISAAVSFGLSLNDNKPFEIWLGSHADDFSYADCSNEFSSAMCKAVQEGTYHLVDFVYPLKNMTKADVVKTGLELKTPYEFTWSCYEGGDKPCGQCASCLCRRKAFELNGVKDPALED